MLEEMTAAQFDEWMAFYKLDPWSGERDDLRIAMLTARVYNYLRGDGERQYLVYDFMPYSEKPRPTQEQLQAKLMAYLGGC